MTVQDRVERMERCPKFDRCSASICPLDPLTEGCYVQGDKICPFILDYQEGREFPLRNAVIETEPLWRVELNDKVLAYRLVARKKFKEYWANKNASKNNKTATLNEATLPDNDESLVGGFMSNNA